jgi:hypothetical protein
MKPAWKTWFVLFVLAVLAIGGTSVVLQARAQGQQSGVRWEYAWVDLPTNGAPMLTCADRREPILLSTEEYRRRFSDPEGLMRTRIAGALDIAGQEGWEAVGVVALQDGLKVLLKRAK